MMMFYNRIGVVYTILFLMNIRKYKYLIKNKKE